MIKQYLKESAVLTVGSVTQKVVTVIALMIISRIFGPLGVGQITLSLVSVTLFSEISLLGLETTLSKFLASYQKDKINFLPYYKIIIFIVLATSTIAAVLHFTFSRFLAITIYNDISIEPLLKIASLIIIFGNIYTIFYFSFRGLRDYVKMVLMDNIKQVLYLAIIIVLAVIYKQDITSIVLATVVSTILVLIIFLKPLINKISLLEKFKTELRRDILNYSLIAFVITIMGIISQNLDKILIGSLLSTIDVGFYYSAFTFLSILNIVSVSLANTMLSASSQLEEDKKEYFINKTLKYDIILYFTASILFATIPETIIIIFGDEFRNAVTLAFPLFIAGLFQLTYSILNKFYFGSGDIKKMPLLYLLGLVIDAVALIFLIDRFGVFGAGISQIVYYLSMTVMLILMFKTKINKNIIWLTFVNTVAILILREAYKFDLYLRIIVSILVILASFCIIISVITKDEKDYIFNKIRKVFA
ncbi:Polysaccharide biosynthesis protein [Candidatus Tiddalikarchaeum anstoanum]|nr:Polysaccharide biosynthesis protein [Candidatus Tiddalikarchaeum anstoanum]